MRYGSVCSGIEAATVAWHKLGWQAAFFSEIDPAPRSILRHHWPSVPLHGDFTTIKGDEYGPIDLLVGGTPCQSFSVAGLRGGLADDRGNLALEFLRLAQRLRPRWLVWENVPGVFSSLSHDAPDPCPPPPPMDLGCDGAEMETVDEYDSDESHALACFLSGLSELGYGFAYRVLDAQFFGVPQRRRRLFVVGYLGDWRRAAAVLFEQHSLSGNFAPRRQARESLAGPLGSCTQGSGFRTTDLEGSGAFVVAGSLDASAGGADENDAEQSRLVAGAVSSKWSKGTGGPAGDECYNLIAFPTEMSGTQVAAAEDISPALSVKHTMAIATDAVKKGQTAVSFRAAGQEGFTPRDIAPPIAATDGGGAGTPVIAFTSKDHGQDAGEDIAPTLRSMEFDGSHANGGGQIAVAFNITPSNSNKDYKAREAHRAQAVTTRSGNPPSARGGDAIVQSGVRRLTPRECERLQGFPDDYTLVPHRGKPMADGPRYKALGNSMAVPVMEWIGRRIAKIEAMP